MLKRIKKKQKEEFAVVSLVAFVETDRVSSGWFPPWIALYGQSREREEISSARVSGKIDLVVADGKLAANVPASFHFER